MQGKDCGAIIPTKILYQSLIEVNASDTKIVNTVFRLYQSLIEVNASLSFLAARGGLNCINPL